MCLDLLHSVVFVWAGDFSILPQSYLSLSRLFFFWKCAPKVFGSVHSVIVSACETDIFRLVFMGTLCVVSVVLLAHGPVELASILYTLFLVGRSCCYAAA